MARSATHQAIKRTEDYEYTWWSDGTLTRCAIAWEDGSYHRVGTSEAVDFMEWNATDFYNQRSVGFVKPFSFLPPPPASG